MPTQDAPDFAQPLSGVGQQQQVKVNLASTVAASADTLANQPTPGSAPGSLFYATDQIVLYLSTGLAWVRVGLPAGATTAWYSTSVPTGWVAYDGTNLPASTGIYADLFAHLGGLTTPDTQGRVIVVKGTNADVNALGNSDGLIVGSRSPKHNATSNLTLPDHSHQGSGYTGTGVSAGDVAVQKTMNLTSNSDLIAGSPVTFPAIGGTIGPGGSRPTDTPAFITFGLLIAKL